MATKKSLKAAAETAGMFTQAEPEQKATEVKETKKAKEVKQAKPKKEVKQVVVAEEKREKATFSVKIDSEVLKKWRIYSSMNGYGDKGNLTEAALIEYMNRHKLKPEQQAKFDTLISI